jgi:exopolysaccharide biosynthesis polyprenyl glycosylphosphotransferase
MSTDVFSKTSARGEIPSSVEGSLRAIGRLQGAAKFWMAMDVLTILCAAMLTTLYETASGSTGILGVGSDIVFRFRSLGIPLALLSAFAVVLILTSNHLHLYTPARLKGVLHEQRLSAQASLTAGWLLICMLYLTAVGVSRSIALILITLVTIALSIRRLFYRMFIYRRFEHDVATRNVLIVGTGRVGQAIRQHLDSIRHLGYNFKGFVRIPGVDSDSPSLADDVLGSLDELLTLARQSFADEIFLSAPCDAGMVTRIVAQAREADLDIRVVPELYDGLAKNSPIEYIGQFPTIALYREEIPVIRLFLKHMMDRLLSSLALIILAPVMMVIAVIVKLDSSGPVFYCSDRLGKKGRVFRCIKFRTMVADAERRRAELLHMNERDGVLFKIRKDPRITRFGRVLRKYSLDELPQFFNVLRGEMSVVGPRPALVSEGKRYDLTHLRRLDVEPGITGLWQVQARQDPSFDRYISLDVAYIENWSLWLDIKIIIRAVGVLFAATGY